MIDRICCVTGHRDIAAEHLDAARAGLRREISRAVSEGYARFLSGFARGADLLFAEIVAEFKQGCPALQLEAVLPYRDRLRSPDPSFRALIAACDRVRVQSEAYTPTCFFERDRALVEAASLVIAVYDGRPGGGTRYTLRYARSLGREIRQICLSDPNQAEQLEMSL